MNDIEALQMLIKMRELGITPEELQSFKDKFKVATPNETSEDVSRKLFPNELTDDEVLYYSTPYYDELQAQKELRKTMKEEERYE